MKKLFAFLLLLQALSCKQNSIEGTWEIKTMDIKDGVIALFLSLTPSKAEPKYIYFDANHGFILDKSEVKLADFSYIFESDNVAIITNGLRKQKVVFKHTNSQIMVMQVENSEFVLLRK